MIGMCTSACRFRKRGGERSEVMQTSLFLRPRRRSRNNIGDRSIMVYGDAKAMAMVGEDGHILA
jgi:hypothetical protein